MTNLAALYLFDEKVENGARHREPFVDAMGNHRPARLVGDKDQPVKLKRGLAFNRAGVLIDTGISMPASYTAIIVLLTRKAASTERYWCGPSDPTARPEAFALLDETGAIMPVDRDHLIGANVIAHRVDDAAGAVTLLTLLPRLNGRSAPVGAHHRFVRKDLAGYGATLSGSTICFGLWAPRRHPMSLDDCSGEIGAFALIDGAPDNEACLAAMADVADRVRAKGMAIIGL